jgi:Glycosyltransferase family 87
MTGSAKTDVAFPANFVVAGLWAIVLLGICIRIGFAPHSHDVFGTYLEAGRKWAAAEPLYNYTRGFVYSPLIAAFFALFSWLPVSLGSIFWRLLNAALFIGAIFWWLDAAIPDRLQKRFRWLVFLLILPLSLGNFNNGQVNPMIIGLLMIAILAAHEKRWMLSALAVGFATYFKIYPLSVGLLLALLYPRQLGWRLALMLIVLAGVSFFFQRPEYVLEQYQRWFRTRAADNRRMNMDIAPRDFAMILRFLHINLSATFVALLQLLAGAAAAAVCIYGRLREWSSERLIVWVLSAGACWMLLFGPSTEDATYVIIAPPVAFALVEVFHRHQSVRMRLLICASFAFLLVGLILNTFFGLKKTPASMSVQPIGAVLFAVYTVIWLFSTALWEKGRETPD